MERAMDMLNIEDNLIMVNLLDFHILWCLGGRIGRSYEILRLMKNFHEHFLASACNVAKSTYNLKHSCIFSTTSKTQPKTFQVKIHESFHHELQMKLKIALKMRAWRIILRIIFIIFFISF